MSIVSRAGSASSSCLRACCVKPSSSCSTRSTSGSGNGISLPRGLHRVSTSPRFQHVVPAAADTTSSPELSSTGNKDDVTGPMLSPSPFNNNLVRAGVVIASVSAVAGSSLLVPQRFAALAHILAYAVWTGANFWNTFFVGLTMFKNMPRQMFGRVQSKLFPQFFTLTTGANILVLGTLLLIGNRDAPGADTAVITLSAALVGSLANWLFVEPTCTSLMFERYDLENKSPKTDADTARIKTLYQDFSKWHGLSAVLNLAIIAATGAHGWYLAASLSL